MHSPPLPPFIQLENFAFSVLSQGMFFLFQVENNFTIGNSLSNKKSEEFYMLLSAEIVLHF